MDKNKDEFIPIKREIVTIANARGYTHVMSKFGDFKLPLWFWATEKSKIRSEIDLYLIPRGFFRRRKPVRDIVIEILTKKKSKGIVSKDGFFVSKEYLENDGFLQVYNLEDEMVLPETETTVLPEEVRGFIQNRFGKEIDRK